MNIKILMVLITILIIISGCSENEVNTRDGEYESYHECVQNETIIVSDSEGTSEIIRGEDSPICQENFLHPLDKAMYEEQMRIAEDLHQQGLEYQHEVFLEETYQEYLIEGE